MTIVATPDTFAAMLADAEPGQSFTLQPGSYDTVRLPARVFDTPVVIDATGCSVAGLQCYNGGGVNWNGGTIRAPIDRFANAADGYGIHLRWASKVAITNAAVTEARKGAVIDTCTDVKFDRVPFTEIQADGINITASKRVLLSRLPIYNFYPPLIDAAGNPVHQDGGQGWLGNEDLTYHYCTITGLFNASGISDFGGTVKSLRTIVQGCKITVAGNTGISVANTIGAIVRNNTFARFGDSLNRVNVRYLPDCIAYGNHMPDLLPADKAFMEKPAP